jgi:hypothetical protein
MRGLVFLFSIFLFPFSAFAQTPTVVTGTITDPNGLPYSFANISAQLVPSTASPTVLVNGQPSVIFGFRPTTTDANGNFSMSLFCNSAGGGCSVISPGGSQWQFTVSTNGIQPPIGTGPQAFSVTLTITGVSQNISTNLNAAATALSNVSSTSRFSGAPTGSCGAVQNAVDTTTGNYYSCVGGAWIKVGPGGNPGVLVSPVITPNPLVLNVDTHNKGPNPWVDITTFGARTCNQNTTPCAGGLTATMSSGSAVATISSASTFVNGDGVVVYGAGTASGLTVPTGLAVTNVLATMGTGTGLTTPSATGSTTTCYKIIARATGGGYTAASSEACTTTGLAARGAVTVNLSSCTRSGVLVTCTTSTSTPLLVGGSIAEVYIGGTPSDQSFRGWRSATPVDATHFTFIDSVTNTGNGAPTSCTGGTATFFAANHLAWNAVTNAWLYYIYGGASGAETLIGVSRPQNGGIPTTDTTFDDFGPSMMSNMTFPSWIPTTPPSVGANNNLSTTILSGAGTTTLTLNANAGATVTGVGIRLDAGVGVVAAAAAANNSGPLYIPIDPSGNSFVVNNYTDLTPYHLSIIQSNQLWLHETLALHCSGMRWIGDRGTALGFGGGGGANTWGNYPQVFVAEAVPGLYWDSSNGCTMEGINLQGVVANGVLLMLMEQGFDVSLKDDNWTTSTASTDKMGFGLILRQSNGGGQSSSGIIMDKVSFSTGTTSVEGATHNTPFFCNGCGDVTIRQAYNTSSGFIYLGNSQGANLKLTADHYNGGFTPLISVGGGGVGITLAEPGFQIIMDTVGPPCIASFFGSVQIFNNGCTPGGFTTQSPAVTGVVQFSTNGVSNFPVAFNNSLSSQTLTAISSQANTTEFLFNVTGPGGISVGYNSDAIFVNGPPPATPTCSVSAGGSVPIGTWNFVVQPLWWNNLEGTPSLQSAGCTTTTGNQTITINWTPVGGNPKGYYVFAGNGGGHSSFGGNPFAPNVTSTIWSNGAAFGSPNLNIVALGGPTMLLPGNQGVVAPQYAVASPSGVTPTIKSGAGAPSAGLCTTSTGGSIYLRTDGTTTTTLYVCDGATGTWTAK